MPNLAELARLYGGGASEPAAMAKDQTNQRTVMHECEYTRVQASSGSSSPRAQQWVPNLAELARLYGGGASEPITMASQPAHVAAEAVQWRRPKEAGQVVRHHITFRHGLVERVDHATRKMQVRFPDTLKVETRWHTAFYETNVFCDPAAAFAIFADDSGQGIWWQDNQDAVYALMAEGMTTEFPPPQLPLLRSRRPRSTTPGARRA